MILFLFSSSIISYFCDYLWYLIVLEYYLCTLYKQIYNKRNKVKLITYFLTKFSSIFTKVMSFWTNRHLLKLSLSELELWLRVTKQNSTFVQIWHIRVSENIIIKLFNKKISERKIWKHIFFIVLDVIRFISIDNRSILILWLSNMSHCIFFRTYQIKGFQQFLYSNNLREKW